MNTKLWTTAKTWLKWVLIGLAAVVLSLVVIGFVTYKSLPDNSNKTISTFIAPTPDNPVLTALPNLTARPDESGIVMLGDSRDAYLARLALVENAAQSLDVQYYIYHDDLSGRLLTQRLIAAADRGVRVRVLLDDHTLAGMDGIIKAMNDHNNIEVRLFNPYMQRTFRPLGYLSDFFRLNRRMHNKSLTADSIVSVLGGRNIGDEYFDATSGVMFADLDVAVVGKGATDTARQFDEFWNSQSAYPAEEIIDDVSPADVTTISDEAKDYLALAGSSEFASFLKNGNMPLSFAKTRLVHDHPDKVLGQKTEQNALIDLAPIMGGAEKELVIVSPYFVPTKVGEAMLSGLAKDGKSVQILTNTLTANDVAVVHSGYAKYRKALLKNGVKLYELKADATVKPAKIRTVYDGQGASLHAKTFVVDGRILYVGSFNMDPRSANLNTELGLLIDSPTLAKELVDVLSDNLASHTYAVSLDNGKMVWTTSENGEIISTDKEPDSSLWRRVQVWAASRLPIEWLL